MASSSQSWLGDQGGSIGGEESINPSHGSGAAAARVLRPGPLERGENQFERTLVINWSWKDCCEFFLRFDLLTMLDNCKREKYNGTWLVAPDVEEWLFVGVPEEEVQAFIQYIEPSELIRRFAAADGIETNGLVKDQQQLQAEQAQQQRANLEQSLTEGAIRNGATDPTQQQAAVTGGTAQVIPPSGS